MKSPVSQLPSGSFGQAVSRPRVEARAEAVLRAFFPWLLAGVVLLRIAYVSIAGIDSVIYRLTDDSYYYFNTARNIVLGFGVTFDRINPTNGFHPFWMLLLLPIYAWAGTNIEIPLRVISIMLALIAGASIWVAYRVVREWLGRHAAAFTAVFMFHPLVMNYFLNGLETGLFLLLMLVLVRVEQTWRLTTEGGNLSRNVIFGGLLGVVFLSRLDSIFLILALFVAWLLRCLRTLNRSDVFSRILQLVVAGTVFTVLGSAYFAWNYLTLGHLMPISGALKSSFPQVTLSFEPLASINGYFHLTGVVGFWALWTWLPLDRHSNVRRLVQWEDKSSAPSLFVPLWFGATGQFFYELLFTKWGTQWWHFAAQVVPLLLLGALVFALLIQWSKKPIAAPLLASAALLSLFFAVLEPKVRGAHHEPWWNAIAWVKEHTPSDAVFAMTDSGFFGYFSERRTVNLDGVINSYAFQEALRDGTLGTFLKSAGVQYVVDYEVPVSEKDRPRLPLKERFSKEGNLTEAGQSVVQYVSNSEQEPVASEVHKIRLKDRLFPEGRRTDILATPQAEVYHSAPYADYVRIARKGGHIAFVIWRFDRLTIMPAAR